MFKTQLEFSSEEIFDYLKMFNYLAVSDERLSSRLLEQNLNSVVTVRVTFM